MILRAKKWSQDAATRIYCFLWAHQSATHALQKCASLFLLSKESAYCYGTVKMVALRTQIHHVANKTLASFLAESLKRWAILELKTSLKFLEVFFPLSQTSKERNLGRNVSGQGWCLREEWISYKPIHEFLLAKERLVPPALPYSDLMHSTPVVASGSPWPLFQMILWRTINLF